MAAKQVGVFWRVGDLIALFVQMGCELREAEAPVRASDGETYNLRYLFNPENGRHVPLLDLNDDDSVSKWEVASWERRLEITVPKPD